jgi:hypothetical protein
LSLRALAVALGLATLAAPGARAQEASRPLGLLLSHSVTSGTASDGPGCLCGQRTDVLAPISVSSLELELTLSLRSAVRWGLEVPVRAVPLVVVRNNPISPAYLDGSGRWAMSVDTPRASTLGFGVKPIGLRAWTGSRRVRLHAEVSAGVVRFGSPLLASNATRFNFAYDMGVGIRMEVPGAGRAELGFRRQHLSNAGLGKVNPGLDSHVAYIGFWLY